jgi:hypothetical protein
MSLDSRTTIMRYGALIFLGLLLIGMIPTVVEAKHKTNLYTPEEIAIAREKIKKELWAKQEYDAVIKRADEWLTFSDEELRRLIPSAAVPRAFDVHFKQCPIHAEEIKKYGSYPWIIDLKNPWKVKCPVGGEYYPSNDFDPENPGSPGDVTEEEFIDTGWGWRKPGEPQKYWFVAYFNHWAIHGHIVPGAEVLGKAYLLTGDRKYSRKAAVILDRLAEVYPEMDHVSQSRYGTEIQVGTYHGRIVNCIWETGLVTTAARAYDFIYEGLDGDSELEERLGKSIAQIKENIETNFLEDAARSLYTMDGRIRGNYGMHQRAMATIAVVLDNENSDKYVDWVLFNAGEGGGYMYQGMASGLINLLYRDGVGFESSPHYNNLWIGTFTTVAEVLLKRGINLYEDYPRMKAMFHVPIELVMNGEFTPNIGDAGNVLSKGREGWNAGWYELAFRRYQDPLYAKVMAHLNTYGRDLFQESINNQVVDMVKAHGTDIEYKSRNLSGYGLALLRGGKSSNPLSVSLYYGKGGGHDHWARLNIEVFGKGMRLVPDLGYPEFMSGFHKKLCGWTGHTISHATVLVDEKRQFTKEAGRLHHFATLPGIQYVDVGAEAAYTGLTEMYRRSLALIDTPDGEDAYILDIFRVKGGSKHDYSIHGPSGVFGVEGVSLSAMQKKGTLAGEDVPFGTLYDAPHLETPGYTGGYSSYMGSGFGYLFNVQKAKGQDIWSATWDLKDGMKSKLKMTFLGEDNEIVVAEGEPPKKGGNIPTSLKYILRRRAPEDGRSTFITFIEPCKEKPFIKGISSLGDSDTAVAFKVDYGDASDYIIQDIEAEKVKSFSQGLKAQAGFARLTLNDKEQVIGAAMSNGRLLEKDGFRLSIEKGYSGYVEEIDYDGGKVVVRLHDESAPLPTNGALEGRSLVFANEYHSTEYEIHQVKALPNGGYEIAFVDNDFLCGYGRAKDVKAFASFLTVTADRDLFKREFYKGMYLVNSDRSQDALIVRAEGTGFLLKAEGSFDLQKSQDFYIYDFGIGSEFTIDTLVSIKQEPVQEKKGFLFWRSSPKDSGNWDIELTSSVLLKLPGGKALEYLNGQGQWVKAKGNLENGYLLEVTDFPGGRGVLRWVD